MSDYTGDVEPGGSADVRELAHLTITKVAVDPEMSNNCYLLRCRHTGDQVLVDAAAEPDTLLPLIGDAGLTTVVTTHQHWDHHRALADVVAATGAEVVVGAPDADAVTEQTGVPVTRTVTQGATVAVGDCTLEVIAIAGHTPGSIALLYDDPDGHPHLFTGDSLFPGGVGNTFGDEARLHPADRRRRDEGVPAAARRHLVLPRPRRRLDPRRRATLARGVARPRLVTCRVSPTGEWVRVGMALVSSNGFAHVRLTVTDIARSKEFYDQVFGWPTAVDASAQVDEAGVKDDPEQFYGGVVYQTPQGTLFGLRPVGSSGFDPDTTGLDHLSFAVESREDLEAALGALEDAGITHGEIIDLGDAGLAILSFQDPDDINIELTAPLPADERSGSAAEKDESARGDHNLNVRDSGGEGRPVVLIHGWPLSGESWSEQTSALQEAGYRTVVYDRRGFGKSDPGDSYDYDALSDDLDNVLSDLDLSDVTLVGFSMGGGEVARYASRHGLDRVHSVVFAAAVPPYLLKSDDNPDGPLTEEAAGGMESGLKDDRDAFFDDFTRQFFSAGDELKVTEEQRQSAVALCQAVRPGGGAGLHGGLRHDRLPR